MNKTAVRAFRKYARYGFDKRELDVFSMCEIVRGVSRDLGEANELVSVYQTLHALQAAGRSETVRALKAVYFSFPSRPLKKNEISYRVRYFAMQGYMDERTVYRHLKLAKSVFEYFYRCGIKNIK